MKNVIIGLMVGIALIGGLLYGYEQKEDLGSVNIANEYHYASSTGAGAVLVQTGHTVLGSVIILEDSAHAFTISNATSTTDLSGTVVGVIEASAPHGTYTFDISLSRGLVIEPAASFAGEFITTYR